MLKKVIQKIKSYRPAKHICFLYFLIPVFLSVITDLIVEEDIWFLLNHGEYVLNHGIPWIEPFTMHQGFSFVMQQWLSAVIFYLSYNILGQYGLLILIVLVNALILFFLYKLCMLISNYKYTLSVIISCITDILLLLFFIKPRPQIFTYLILLIILYIMELFYKDKKSKVIYFLPLLSLIEINLHSSMWFMIYLFILPYLVCLGIEKIKNRKDNRIFKLLLILVIMFLVGFINPYGIKGITYVFKSYGNFYINDLINEMMPPIINNSNPLGIITFTLIGIVLAIYIIYKKGKFQLRHMFLFAGVIILALCHGRNLSLYIIGTIPFLASYLKDTLADKKEKVVLLKKQKIYYVFILSCCFIYLFFIGFFTHREFSNKLEKGIDYLLENNNVEDIRLYTNYNNGSYAEYRGLKSYMDTRAEVFLEANNKKEDVFVEYYYLVQDRINYDEFIEKYQFTHLLITKFENLYIHVSEDDRYQIIYDEENYSIFEKVEKEVSNS